MKCMKNAFCKKDIIFVGGTLLLLSLRPPGDSLESITCIFGGGLSLAQGLKLFYLLGGVVVGKYHCVPHNLPHLVCRDLHWEG